MKRFTPVLLLIAGAAILVWVSTQPTSGHETAGEPIVDPATQTQVVEVETVVAPATPAVSTLEVQRVEVLPSTSDAETPTIVDAEDRERLEANASEVQQSVLNLLRSRAQGGGDVDVDAARQLLEDMMKRAVSGR